MASNEMVLKPIGVVKNKVEDLSLVATEKGLECHSSQRGISRRNVISEIEINDEYANALDGIDDFSHLVVLFWAHRVEQKRRFTLKVHPAGREHMPLVGVFATRSPARPNLILSTTVHLLERNGNVLRVRGLDSINGTPVLDIKPHLPSYDAPENVSLADWMVKLQRELGIGGKNAGGKC